MIWTADPRDFVRWGTIFLLLALVSFGLSQYALRSSSVAVLVASQAVWNGGIVAVLIGTLISFVGRRGLTADKGLIILLWFLVPLSIYVGSAGSLVILPFVLLLLVRFRKEPRFYGIRILPDAVQGRRFSIRLDLITLVATLMCSLYNFNASPNLFPYWSTIFENVDQIVDYNTSTAQIFSDIYRLGFDGFPIPDELLLDRGASTTGSVVFFLIWSFLPTVYCIYFAVLYINSSGLPFQTAQRFICVIGIIHFLTITDVVDYAFGRGYQSEGEMLAHWIEVFVWRFAILLPVIQKLLSKDLLKDGRAIGRLLYIFLLAWAAFFVTWEVALLDIPRFTAYILGYEYEIIKFFGMRPKEFGYNGALLMMVFVYFILLIFFSGKWIEVSANQKPAIGNQA